MLLFQPRQPILAGSNFTYKLGAIRYTVLEFLFVYLLEGTIDTDLLSNVSFDPVTSVSVALVAITVKHIRQQCGAMKLVDCHDRH